jgi:hypothetical protein
MSAIVSFYLTGAPSALGNVVTIKKSGGGPGINSIVILTKLVSIKAAAGGRPPGGPGKVWLGSKKPSPTAPFLALKLAEC